LALLRIAVGYGYTAEVMANRGWFREYLAIPASSSDPLILIIFVEFLECASRLFHAEEAMRVWKTARQLFRYSVKSRARGWKVLQKSILEESLVTVRCAYRHVPFLGAGILNDILVNFGRLEEYNQVGAIALISECFQRGIPPDLFATRKVLESLDYVALFEALRSENRELKAGAMDVLERLFIYNGDIVETAIEMGLLAILVELIDTGNFEMKVTGLRLVKTMVLRCNSALERKPFLGAGFPQLLRTLIDDEGSSEVHESAREALLLLQYACGPEPGSVETFAPLLGAG
jgi:hypothetical protein